MNKKDLISRLVKIFNTIELLDKFRAKYATDFTMVKASIESDLIKPEAIKFIIELSNFYGLSDLEYHREPTKREINFGEGATHYKEFSPLQYLKPNGEVKTWLKCPIDGLRYYY